MASISVSESSLPEFAVQRRDRDGNPTGFAPAPAIEELAGDELARLGYRLPVGVRIDVDDTTAHIPDEGIAVRVVRHFGR
jgi:hypothetical protein